MKGLIIMIETRNRLSSYSKYAILKDCSSIKEKDNLIQKILSNNSEFSEKANKKQSKLTKIQKRV